MVTARLASDTFAIGGVIPRAGEVSPSELVGTAFAVATRVALTAFHCVGDRISGEVTCEKPTLWIGGKPIAARVVESYSDLDVAVLELDEPIPESLRLIPVSLQVRIHTPFHAPGWPEARSSTASYLTITGEVADNRGSIFDGIPAIQLFVKQAASLPLKGFSGAPVLVEREDGTHAAVGLVRWNPQRPDAPSLAQGQTAFASPLHALLERCPDLHCDLATDAKPAASKGFCICYSKYDEDIALWIVHILRRHGYEVMARYDYLPKGENFAKAITAAHAKYPDILILVTNATMSGSPHESPAHIYELHQLSDGYAAGLLVPIRVEPVALPDFLRTRDPIDLFDADTEAAATDLILTGLDPTLLPSPAFPSDRFLPTDQSLSRNRLPRATVVPTGMIEGGS